MSQVGAARDERGAGTAMVLGVAAVLVAVFGVLVAVGAVAATTARARQVADLAALAGARAVSETGAAGGGLAGDGGRGVGNGAGCAAARATAEANGARLSGCELSGDAVAFVVGVRVEMALPLRLPGLDAPVRAQAYAGSGELAGGG